MKSTVPSKWVFTVLVSAYFLLEFSIFSSITLKKVENYGFSMKYSNSSIKSVMCTNVYSVPFIKIWDIHFFWYTFVHKCVPPGYTVVAFLVLLGFWKSPRTYYFSRPNRLLTLVSAIFTNMQKPVTYFEWQFLKKKILVKRTIL